MADDDTPVTPPASPPEPPQEPPTPPAQPAHDDGWREAVARLQETVDGLTQQVAALTPVPGDDTPTSRPWTHRGIR